MLFSVGGSGSQTFICTCVGDAVFTVVKFVTVCGQIVRTKEAYDAVNQM